MANAPLERGMEGPSTPESVPSIVHQPGSMSKAVQSFLAELNETISESSGAGPGENLPITGGGSTTAVAQTSQSSGISPRSQAIANLPAPAVMQREIEKHIQLEVKHLRKEARRIARLGRPGAAFHLNELYTKIHRLNALLAELVEASFEVLKRLYIRIFVDKQPIL